jgi:hypothetical protein
METQYVFRIALTTFTISLLENGTLIKVTREVNAWSSSTPGDFHRPPNVIIVKNSLSRHPKVSVMIGRIVRSVVTLELKSFFGARTCA